MQFITVAVDFQNIAERVFHVDHAIRLFPRIVVARCLHPSFTTCCDDLFGQFLDVGVLHRKMEYACFPVFKIIFWIFLVPEFKQLDADTVARLQVGDAKTLPS